MQKITPSNRYEIPIRIFLVSIWMLFLEIWLIRWISTEIRIYAYVNNLVLLSCFLGISAGCTYPETKPRLSISFTALFCLILAVNAWPFTLITNLLSMFTDSVIWFGSGAQWSATSLVQGLGLTLCVFFMTAAVFFPLGQLLGGLFNAWPRTITAYSINILGSITGIWLFAWLSFVSTPPLFWFLVACLPALFLLRNDRTERIAFALMVIFCTIILSISPRNSLHTIWSPYQKLSIVPSQALGIPNGFTVNVNNVGYMGLIDLSRAFVEKHFGNNPEVMRAYSTNQYEIPYLAKPNARQVLIVGSGGGNDVAGALRRDMAEIDAVEIDPEIYRLGKLLHPEQPYSDPRVHVTIDDARSFFHSRLGKKHYDLIIFGLLDSHTLSSSYNNVRLDHYVYTLESLRQAKALLKPDGVLSLAFDAQRPWIYSRIHGLLTKVFGQAPIALTIRSPQQVFGWGGVVFLESLNPAAMKQAIANNEALTGLLRTNALPADPAPVRLSTDDWPYLYLEKAHIPDMYLCILGSLAVLFLFASRVLFRDGNSLQLHFFFLGAAFMLLEFQNISKTTLLFGSTWLVNAYTITAILVLILCANLLVEKIKTININATYALLIGSILLVYFLPPAALQYDNPLVKSVVVCGLYNLPVFFASLIFIHSFSATPDKSAALGSNLFGASLGGMLETLSFVTGVRALLLVVALCYICSLVTRKRMLPAS